MERLLEEIKALFVEIYYAILGGRDHTLKASFERESKLISRKHTGFSVNGTKFLTLDQSRKNMAVLAPSGGGKSTVILFPSIFNIGSQNSSMIINDPSGELSQTIPFLIDKGYNVQTYHLGEKANSIYYNPISRLSDSASIMKVASMLTRVRSGNDKDNFWSQSATACIGLFIQYLIESAEPKYRHLAQVFSLLEELQGDENVIEKLLSDTATAHTYRKFRSIIGTSEATKSGVIASALACLSFIGDDPLLSDQTSADTIDFASFRDEKSVLFLRCPLGDVGYYSPVLSLFFEQFFSAQFKELPAKNALDVFMLIDEISSLTLPSFENVISNSRKFNMPILYALQSENQLIEKYGFHSAKTIQNNANVKIYFSGLSDESYDLERTLGQFDYEEDGRMHRRSLLTQDEIRAMRQDQILIVPTAMKPIKTRVRPHYKQPKLIEYLDMELPDGYESKTPNHTAEFIDLEPIRESLKK